MIILSKQKGILFYLLKGPVSVILKLLQIRDKADEEPMWELHFLWAWIYILYQPALEESFAHEVFCSC